MPQASILRALRGRAPLFLSLAGGATFALTAPPTDLVPAVIVGLALLAAAVHDAPTVWRAFGRGAAWGTAAGIVGLRFVPEVIQRFTPLGSANRADVRDALFEDGLELILDGLALRRK